MFPSFAHGFRKNVVGIVPACTDGLPRLKGETQGILLFSHRPVAILLGNGLDTDFTCHGFVTRRIDSSKLINMSSLVVYSIGKLKRLLADLWLVGHLVDHLVIPPDLIA